MSFELVSSVMNHSQSRGIDKLVLLVIAHHFNDKTEKCFPSYESIAEMAGLSRATVARSISSLVASGELIRHSACVVRSATGLRKSSNSYELGIMFKNG